MVTMHSSYWQSVTILIIVAIVSINFSSVSSFCSDKSDFCIAENRLDHQGRQLFLKERHRGNVLDRTFRDSLRREISSDQTRRTEIDRIERRLNTNTRSVLSRRDHRAVASDEQTNRQQENRFDDRQLADRSERVGKFSRRIETDLRRVDLRNDIQRTSDNLVREERAREQRILNRLAREKPSLREQRQRINQRTERVEERIREERDRYEQVREDRMNREIREDKEDQRRGDRLNRQRANQVDQRIREERLNRQVRADRERLESQVPESREDQRIREDRANRKVHEDRVRRERAERQVRESREDQRIREDRINRQVREDRVRRVRVERQVRERENQRIRESRVDQRTREDRVDQREDQMDRQFRVDSVQRNRDKEDSERRISEVAVREHRMNNREGAARRSLYDRRNLVENMGDVRTRRVRQTNDNRREMRRLDLADRSNDFTRSERIMRDSMDRRTNEDRMSRNERASEDRVDERFREDRLNSNFRLNEEEHNRRDILSHRLSNDNRRREALDENRNEQRYQEGRERRDEMRGDERRFLNTLDDNRRIESRKPSRMEYSLKRETENDSTRRLSVSTNDYRLDTAFKQRAHFYSPQLTWSFCQALLVGAIVLQLLKSKKDMIELKSFNAYMNYLPSMYPVKAL